MKYKKANLQVSLVTIFICVFATQAHADMFDDFKNKASDFTRQVFDGTVDDVIKSQPSEASSEPAEASSKPAEASSKPAKSPQKPLYDRRLVADTQSQLNRLGYNAGTVDGLYGNGTRQAIVRFQRDENLAVNGEPSASLLSKMETSSSTQQEIVQNSSNTSAVPPPSHIVPQAESASSHSKTTPGPVEMPDVVGLRLGMTPEEAITVLKGRNKAYVIEKVMFSERQKSPMTKQMGSYLVDSVSYVRGHLPDKSEVISVVFPAHPAESLSQGIDRIVTYSSEGPLKQNVIDAVHGKYGARESLFWQFDKNYHLLDYDLMSAHAYGATCGSVAMMNARRGLTHTYGMDKKCQTFLRIDIKGTDDIVTGIRTILIDGPKSNENLAKTHQYIADAKERDKQTSQNAAAKRSTPDF